MKITEIAGLDAIIDKKAELYQAFEDVSQSRSDYQLKHFVVGQHESPERRYLQIVLELQRKVSVLRRAKISLRQSQRKYAEEVDADERELIALDIEDGSLAISGAMREFNYLYAMYLASPKFTAEQLQEAEQAYWETRLARQSSLDIEATGRIGVGNLDALRQAGMLPNLEGQVGELKLTLKRPKVPGVKHALVS